MKQGDKFLQELRVKKAEAERKRVEFFYLMLRPPYKIDVISLNVLLKLERN